MTERVLVKNASLQEIAEAIREVNGQDKKYYVAEMPDAIRQLVIAPLDDTNTYILVTEDGQEIPAVLVEEATVFDATENDIRAGKVAATDKGVTLGTKEIPAYYSHEGQIVVMPNESVKIVSQNYNYTKLQAIVCAFNSTLANSVSAERVAISDNVYEVQSTVSLSAITKNETNKAIEFGVVNESSEPQILRYFYFREEQ